MAYLRTDEVGRLLSYLRQQTPDTAQLAWLEDELRSAWGAEFLREPELIAYFPPQTLELIIATTTWRLRIIGYTRLRMVQRGFSQATIVNLFTRFIAHCQAEQQLIVAGPYTIYGRPAPHSPPVTLRVDIDVVSDEQGQAHTVTVFIGRGDTAGTEAVDLM